MSYPTTNTMTMKPYLFRLLAAGSMSFFSIFSVHCSSESDSSDSDRCPQGAKSCSGLCVSVLEPAAGCGAVSCEPCEALANATSICSESAQCKLGECKEGFADCDQNPNNGCEVDTRDSVEHCGACGQSCVVNRGASACNAGKCEVQTCDAGYGDCDDDPANGCETDIKSDGSNCGTCGNGCDGGTSCVSGSCVFANMATWLASHNGGWCNDTYNKIMNLCGDVAFCFEDSYMRTYPDGIAIDFGFYYDGVSIGNALDLGGDCENKRVSMVLTTPGVLSARGPFMTTNLETQVQEGRHLLSYRVNEDSNALFLDGELVASGSGSATAPELLGECGPGFILGQRISYWWEQPSSVVWFKFAPFFVHLRDSAGSTKAFTLEEVAEVGTRTVAFFDTPSKGVATGSQWPALMGPTTGVLCGGALDPETGDIGPMMPCDKSVGWVENLEKDCPALFE